jgi:hypothetical protein
MQSQNWRYEMICPFKHIFQFHREVRKSWPNKAKIYATRIKVTKNAKGKIVPYKRIMRLVSATKAIETLEYF